jgi:hypothetical protein
MMDLALKGRGLHAIESVISGIAFVGFAWLVLLHVIMVLVDAPMEMRDGAMMATTAALLDGRNPYALAGLMQTGNAYGILYPLAVVPFALVLGPGFVAHRLVAAIGIAGACLIVFRWLRLGGVARRDALLGSLIVYAGLIYFTGGVARPDGLGTFLMLAAIDAVRRRDCDGYGFAACLLLSLLGLLSKLYFVWPAFAVATYVFLCRDWRRGLVYGLTAIAATAATLVLASLILPGYAGFALIANLRDADYVPAYLWLQIRDWALFDLPFLVCAATLLPLLRFRRWKRDVGLFPAMTILGTVALVFCLGGHTGAHLSYFFQLLSPFLAIVVLVAAKDDRPALAVFRLALPAALLLNAQWFPLSPVRILDAGRDFAADRTLIAGSGTVLTTTEFAGALVEAHRDLAETGHAEYLVNATQDSVPAWLAPLVPHLPEISTEWRREVMAIAGRVDDAQYDLVLIGARPTPLIPQSALDRHYRQAGTLTIDMPWALQRWPVRVLRPGG